MTKRYSDAYNTGFEAAAQGELRDANPYSAVTWDRDEWFRGFDGDEMTTEKRKIVLRISICPTGLEQGFEGDMLDPELLLAEIESVAAKRWPAAEIEFETLQIGFRQGDEFAECWIDGVRDDEQARQVIADVDYSDEDLYQDIAEEE